MVSRVVSGTRIVRVHSRKFKLSMTGFRVFIEALYRNVPFS